MPTLRIMTFNVENLLARFNFRWWEKERLATLLDSDSEVDRANLIRTHWNVINDENRVFTALTAKAGAPEVICLQEIESMRTLEAFHDRYLRRLTGQDFRHKILIEGNDRRGIDVAVLSRYKIDSVTSHREHEGVIHYPDGDETERVFRRDCLEVHVKRSNKTLPIFVCHFKSMSGGRAETRPKREAEALAVKEILGERFSNPAQADWLVVGDLNDYTETDGTPDTGHGLSALMDNSFSVDLVKRIADPLDRWTHYYPSEDTYHQIDYLLASPSLAQKNANLTPTIVRNGQPYRADRYDGDRWPRVGYDRPKASDHCPVVADVSF